MVIDSDKDKCTCGESSMSGHYLWCACLIGQREYRPADPSRIDPEEIRAACSARPELAIHFYSAIAGDMTAIVAICDGLNRAAKETGRG